MQKIEQLEKEFEYLLISLGNTALIEKYTELKSEIAEIMDNAIYTIEELSKK